MNSSGFSAEKVEKEQGSNEPQPALYLGNDQLINPVPTRQPVELLGDDVTLNFEQAPLMEVIQAVMGDVLELDYVIDGAVNGQVTLRTFTPIPREQLLVILESLLESRQVSIVRLTDGRYFITASKAALRMAPTVSSAESQGIGSGIVVIPLQYVSAAEMAEILAPVADPSAFIRVDGSRNLLMMVGSRVQVNGWLDIVESFDVDKMAGMSVGIFPVENSVVDDVEAALQTMFTDPTGKGDGATVMQGLVRIIPLQTLNSILVITPRAGYLTRIKQWIERLDQLSTSSTHQELFVYPVQNRSVAELAQLLTGLFGSGEDSESTGGGVAPGMNPERITSQNSQQRSNTTRTATATTSFTIGDARVVADEGNNSLLIYASGQDFRKISRALSQLDVNPTQVLIEASIIEVSLTDGLQYGFQWALENDIGSNNIGFADLIPSEIPTSGLTYTVTNALTGDIRGALRALASKSLLNVISTPSVMVLDNYTASLEAGSSVPYNAGSYISGDGSSNIVTNNIQYRDIGVDLEVTPSVNAGGLVTLDIIQSVTDIGLIEAVTGQRQFDERSISSRVAVRSGETVVLGGLIRDNRSESSGGIPLLHQIPLIGGIFGTKTRDSEQTELVVLITPTVIFNDQELRDATNDYRKGIRNLELMDLPE